MRHNFFILLMMAVVLVAMSTTTEAYIASDVCVHYTFDDTSGTAFVDSSPNGNDATFYSKHIYGEESFDASLITSTGGVFGNAMNLGWKDFSGTDKAAMVDIPTASQLPGVNDTFAVSFWLSTVDWGGADGVVGSYKYNDLAWTIGMQSRDEVNGLVISTNSADASGTGAFVANCVDASLVNDTMNHFVVQFDGAAGISQVYINGTAVSNTMASGIGPFAVSEPGMALGGRIPGVAPSAYYGNSPIAAGTYLDDFAVIDGSVDTTDLANLAGTGASALGARRLLHLTMDDTTGSVVTDSSSYANNASLTVHDLYASETVHDVATATRPGKFGNAVELRGEYLQYANLDSAGVDALPGSGESFTVSFWLKPDEFAGWDHYGVITSWSNDGMGISISQLNTGTGTLVIRTTDGTYTGGSRTYGVEVGTGGLDLTSDEFHHFAVTVDDARNVTGIYIDGDSYASNMPNGAGVTLPETGYVGTRVKAAGCDWPLCSYVDDFAVIKGELSEVTIENIMAKGVANVPEPSMFVLLLSVLAALGLTRFVKK